MKLPDGLPYIPMSLFRFCNLVSIHMTDTLSDWLVGWMGGWMDGSIVGRHCRRRYYLQLFMIITLCMARRNVCSQ